MTVPHYGKREPGLLTAASPGDTLYFNFGSYNDSGDSEAMTGFAVTDIEVIKNGSATVRATDSGYSLISDTGQVGDRVGLHRFSVQLFNTADDSTFYASGSWYQVFVDAVTIDGKTVRFWCGSFEIGRQKVNAVEIDSDTGAANVLKQFAGTNGTLSPTGELDTGSVANNSWLRSNMIYLVGDTGAAIHAQQAFANGFHDTGINDRLDRIGFDVDTGLRSQISDVDTGLHDTIADLDTGLRDYIDNTDTGLRAILQTTGVVVSAFSDTGVNDRLGDIQTKTDQLTFTQAGQVDSNVQYVNDVQVNGTGASGNEWGP